MAISFRYYLFLDDGSIRRIAQRITSELPFGRDAIPEFAGTRQRVVNVVLELEDLGRESRLVSSTWPIGRAAFGLQALSQAYQG